MAARFSSICLAVVGTGCFCLAAVFCFHDQHLRISVSCVQRGQHELVTGVVPGHDVHVGREYSLTEKVKAVLCLDMAACMASW